MQGMIAGNVSGFKTIANANRYANSLIATKGRKVCTELARATNRSHDAVQRDLDAVAKNADEVKAQLLSNAIRKNKEGTGYLIVDHTVLIKEHAEKIEGVSRQHSGSEIKPGIGVTAVVLSTIKGITPAGLFAWKKGDQSKTKTATDATILLAQKIGVRGILADGAFASVESLDSYEEAGVFYTIRFHSNRVISVPGFEGAQQIRKHPAFKMMRNTRYIVREVFWYGKKRRVIAFKVRNKRKGWMIIYLVTNMPTKEAHTCAGLYKKRWKIETFFRTCKQKLGMGDCQARSLKSQEAHCLGVFLAYSKTN